MPEIPQPPHPAALRRDNAPPGRPWPRTSSARWTPQRQRIEAAADDAVLAPERQQRLRQPAPAILVVMADVDAGGGAVILAAAMDGGGIGEAAQIMRQSLGRKRRQPGRAGAAFLAPIGLGIGPDHPLREWRWLDQEEPVPIGAGEGVCGVGVHFAGGRDVERRQPRHAVRVVERQPVGATRAPRSCAPTMKRSWPRALMASAMSCAMARLE